ncbi:MAG: VTT domain-containing protein [Acidobacteriota bacterium]
MSGDSKPPANGGRESNPAGESVPDALKEVAEAAQAGIRGAALRFGLFIGVVIVVALVATLTPLRGYLTREHLLALMGSLRAAWWSPAVLLGLYAILAPLGLPMSPLIICGAVLFGPVRGSFYNLAGLYIGALLSYWFARSLGRDLVVRLAGKKLKKAERIVARRGFWTLVGARLLPLPFPVVNFGAALAGVRPAPFIFSSMIGMLLPTALYTVLWHTVATAAEGESHGPRTPLVVAFAALVALSVLPTLISLWLRRRRYRRLLEQRSSS